MGMNVKRRVQRWSWRKKFLLLIGVIIIIGIIVFGVFIINAVKTSPKVNPSNILNEMNLNSVILDEDGNLLEQLRSDENRTIVQLNEIPKDLQNAIVAIEDQRFRSHSGLDFKGIVGAIVSNLKAGGIVRGASTLTQQLAKNVYLTSEIKFDRKIKEALIARKLEKNLSKDQILEAYLNSIYLGEGAYGVQEAASTYFDKDVSELNLAESALIAGITKNPSNLVPYFLVKPENVNADSIVIGDKDILGEKYKAVFNPQSLDRQKIILNEMVEQGYISQEEANEAANENIKEKLVVKNEEKKDISSYFSDYLKESVIDDLINEQGYTPEDAERKLYTGGFKIYATVDSTIQKEIEDIYDNLSDYINMSNLSNWKNDDSNNIISDGNNPGIVYYAKNNLLNSEDNVFISADEFKKNSSGDIVVDSPKLNIYSGALDINDYYTIDNMGNLVIHDMGRLSLNPDSYQINKDGTVAFKSTFINEHPDFASINEEGDFIIDKSYFLNDEDGIVQPQSATVIIDQSTGYVKAMVGGRSNNGKKVVNRATKPRQTGSIMKPIGAYLPALDNGFTAATPIDDVPFLNEKGEVWPNNYDFRSRGLITLRESVEQSINTNAVKTVDQIGIKKSMSYLEKMGIISKNGNDTFVTAKEDKKYNDENLSALALGGLTHGISPVKMTGAYASIANQGKYLKTTAYSKIEDHNGEIVIDNKPEPVKVVSPETAYVMTDILHTTVSNGLSIAQKARITGDNESIPVAGKTGTTDQNADVWFSGFTPYYTASVWVGNDSMSVKLSRDSGLAAEIWSTVMRKVHEDLEPKKFEEPENIVRAQVCTLSGKAPSRNCELDPRNVVKEEIFAKGTEPEQPCEQHVYLRVHRNTNNLAGPSCPSYLTFSKLFFKREPAYDPSKHNNVLPEDHEYDPPSQTTNCN